MRNKLWLFAFLMLIFMFLILAGCGSNAGTPSVSTGEGLLLPMDTQAGNPTPCDICAQATLYALQTQAKSAVDAQAAATAEILRANAQATLDAASSTLSAAQTQEQNNANIVAAQITATADVERANIQATTMSAGSTQSAALTQDAVRQTQVQFSQQMTADVATQNAIATATQESNILIAAGTQTAVSNLVATQTQSAVATSQWYADQARLRKEQLQAPITFLFWWGLPIFIALVAIVSLFFFWRGMKIQETRQLIEMQKQPPEFPVIIEHEPRQLSDSSIYPYPLGKRSDHIRVWLDEARRKLVANKKDHDDNPDN